jgi:hypothetical protein
MKARHLVGSSSFGPEALKGITQAFDDAWNSIAAKIGNNPLAIEAARLKLANIILAIAQNEGGDPEQLKRAALDLMAKDLRTGAT